MVTSSPGRVPTMQGERFAGIRPSPGRFPFHGPLYLAGIMPDNSVSVWIVGQAIVKNIGINREPVRIVNNNAHSVSFLVCDCV